MTKDYSGTLATARRLVNNFGRQVTFLQLASGAPGTEPDKPWRGSAAQRAAPVAQTTADAVAVPPSDGTRLGLNLSQPELLKSAEQIFIVAPPEVELDPFHLVQDGGQDYRILFIEKLRPATVTLLYFVGVAR